MSDDDKKEFMGIPYIEIIAGIKLSIKRWFYYSCDDVINVIAKETYMWEELQPFRTSEMDMWHFDKVTKRCYYVEVVKALLQTYAIGGHKWIKKSKLREILKDQKVRFNTTYKAGHEGDKERNKSVLGFYKDNFE